MIAHERNDTAVIYPINASDILLTEKKMFPASPEEKKVIDAINKQKEEIKKEQEEAKQLLDRIVAAIEEDECSSQQGKRENFDCL